MQPLVSVITPTHNCAQYLKETIDSVKAQTYKNVEHIVLDDGSIDNTQEVLAQFKDRVRIVRHDNMGEHKTVNKGLELARGKYFMLTNADDPLLPKAVFTLIDFMEGHPEVLLAYPDWQTIDEHSKVIANVKTREYDYLYMVGHHYCFPGPGSMYRMSLTERVGYRDPSYRYISDFDYFWRIGLFGPMARVPAMLATWRHWPGQVSTEKGKAMAEEHVRLVKTYYERTDLSDRLLDIKKSAYYWAYIVAAYLSSGKTRARYSLRAVRYYPWGLFRSDTYRALARHAYYVLRR